MGHNITPNINLSCGTNLNIFRLWKHTCPCVERSNWWSGTVRFWCRKMIANVCAVKGATELTWCLVVFWNVRVWYHPCALDKTRKALCSGLDVRARERSNLHETTVRHVFRGRLAQAALKKTFVRTCVGNGLIYDALPTDHNHTTSKSAPNHEHVTTHVLCLGVVSVRHHPLSSLLQRTRPDCTACNFCVLECQVFNYHAKDTQGEVPTREWNEENGSTFVVGLSVISKICCTSCVCCVCCSCCFPFLHCLCCSCWSCASWLYLSEVFSAACTSTRPTLKKTATPRALRLCPRYRHWALFRPKGGA